MNQNKNNVNKNDIVHPILKFFKIGSDVSKIHIPTSLTLPHSILSLFLKSFIQTFDFVLNASKIDDSYDRFKEVYKYIVSTLFEYSVYYKPLNPILGETLMGNFHCKDENGNIHTDNYYCLETYSVEPLGIRCCIYNKKIGSIVNFDYKIYLLFMGTYIRMFLDGKAYINLEKYNEVYEVLPPMFIARILRGFSEVCGKGIITCPNNSKYRFVPEFYPKQIIGGKNNLLDVHIINNETNKEEYILSGQWDGEINEINLKNNEIKPYYKRKTSSIMQMNEDDSLNTDSSKVWEKVFNAHNNGNNKEKSLEIKRVLENQKQLIVERKNNNIIWEPKHFTKNETTNIWDLKNYNK